MKFSPPSLQEVLHRQECLEEVSQRINDLEASHDLQRIQLLSAAAYVNQHSSSSGHVGGGVTGQHSSSSSGHAMGGVDGVGGVTGNPPPPPVTDSSISVMDS